MSLRFIYGRAGSGKTEFCLSDIKKRIEDNESYPLILLVPEMFTFQAEKSLLKAVDIDKNLRTQVLSFKTVANRVFSEVGGLVHMHMKPCGRAMLIYRIIDEVKNDLKVFSKSARQQGFINTVSQMITELKRFEVTPDILVSAVDNVDNVLLKDKLEDISLIFSCFEKNLHEKYIDSEDEMALLANKLEASNQFGGAEIWMDGFSGFTPQQYRVIEKLLKKASRINICLCSDGKGGPYDKTDVFAPTKATEERLIRLCMDNNVSIDKPVDLNAEILPRFKDSKELMHLEGHIFSFPYIQYKEKTEDIGIFKAVNIYSEIEETARSIVALCRDKNMRFSDIVVAARDLKRYEKLVKAIFTEHNIPYFIDQKRDIKSNPIVVFITSAVEIQSKRWSYESVFKYLKTGLLRIGRDDINLLENYILANGIRGKKWLDDEWNYRLEHRFDQKDASQHEIDMIKRINEVRTTIVNPLKDFHEKISGKNRVRDICAYLYQFLIASQIPETIGDIIEQLKEEKELDVANQYNQVWEIVIDVLDQMVEVMGEEIVTLDQFVKILSIGFDEYKIGVVPPALDQVLVSSVDRMKSHNAGALYIIGVNDGVFPAADNDEGILSDRDRENLKTIGIELDHDTRTRAFEEQFLIYTALTSSKKTLRLSYPIADHEGKTMRPSIIVSRMKKIFTGIDEVSNIIKTGTDDEHISLISNPVSTFNEMITSIKKWQEEKNINPLWLDVYRWYIGDNEWKEKSSRILKGLYYTNQTRTISMERSKKLYGSTMHISISRLEKYAECPFAYFVQHGLKVKERKVYGFNPPDMGTFMHNVLDEFSKVLEKEATTWREISKDFCRDAISIIVDDMIGKIPGFILNSSERYKYLSERLKRILTSAVWIIAEHIKRSSFDPLGHEVGFGYGGKYPPIKIVLNGGEEINLIGRIDRVDILKKDDGGYIRIIDYKSGNKSLSLSDIYHGLQIQLLVYLNAILESSQEDNLKLHPAGMLYFRIDDPIIKSKGNMEDSEIEKEIMKKLKMKGLLLKDADIIKSMDSQIKGTSTIIPASINSDGNIGSRTNGATYEQFNLLRRYIKGAIENLSEDMVKGDITIRPYKKKNKTPCEFCAYPSICQFDSSMKDNKYKIINDKKDDEIWTLIGQEVECGE
jgi:ATP-dependent helicase/nuclease subunit B